MTMLTVCRWHGTNNREPQPAPPRAVQLDMLGEIEAELRARSARPIGLDCMAWLRPVHLAPARDAAALALLIVRITPGSLGTPLRSWFQWQHPQWRWSHEPFPELPELTPA